MIGQESTDMNCNVEISVRYNEIFLYSEDSQTLEQGLHT